VKRFSLIIPAAGYGARSGSTVPKQYVPINGVPMLAHTLHAFGRRADCGEIIVAIDPAWRKEAEQCATGLASVRFVEGGAERQHSIFRALAALNGSESIVLVHDAARPCITSALIDRLLEAAEQHGAAIPALPLTDTVKRVDGDGQVVATLARADLRTVQTPQAFRRPLLERAYHNANEQNLLATDDAGLVEALGEPVVVVVGDPHNIKVTGPEDFKRVEALLANAGSL